MMKNLEKRYFGKLVLRELCLFATDQTNLGLCLFLSAVRTGIPFLVRYMEFGNAIINFDWKSWLACGLDFTFVLFLLMVNYSFIFSGYVDFKRRKKIIQACGVMIDPLKANYPAI